MMEPLSCLNCCFNPLQLGPIGLAVGYCTQHHLVLYNSRETTCGRLLRKDVVLETALMAHLHHQQHFREDAVVVLESGSAADAQELTSPDEGVPQDPVFDLIRGQAAATPLVTLHALSRLSLLRAEIAFLSLARGHLARWRQDTPQIQEKLLERLLVPPVLEAVDLFGPLTLPLAEVVPLARWQVVLLRLLLLSDLTAHRPTDRRLQQVDQRAEEAVMETEAFTVEALLPLLRRRLDDLLLAGPPASPRRIPRQSSTSSILAVGIQ